MSGGPGDLSAGDLLGDFRILRPIGKGGMGVVCLARDERLDRRVALKVIAPHLAADEEFRERFISEARSAAAIEHDNAVPVYSAGVVDGVLYIAMRYVDGTDLRAVLAEKGPLAPEEAVSIVVEVAAALDAAHAAGLVHRDVKPANILLRGGAGNRTSYLTDFGLTKGGADSSDSLTGTGQWVGTIDYVAPEQIKAGQVDARTDVYALGCVLYEALTGSVPYAGDDMQKMWGHVNEPFPALPNTAGDGERVAATIARATAKNPDDRFPSAGDLANAAAAALAGGSAETPEHSVATGPAAGLEATATARRAPTDPSAAPTVAGERLDPTERHAQPAARGGRDGGSSLRTGAIVGGAIVIAAGLLAAAVVIAGGGSGSTSTTVTSEQAGGGAEGDPSDGGAGSTDPALPSNATECEANVYVEERVEGAPYTSCPFAREVARAYRGRGEGSEVTAYSPVTGKAYEMTCEGVETVRCSDGKTAIAYLTAPFVSDSSSGGGERTDEEEVSSKTSTGGDLGDWPGGSSYSAMLGAFSSEWRARNRQEEASEKGLDAGVLYSSNFSSLRPGYWIVFSGSFANSSEAAERARRARSLGYTDSYPRFVSP